MAEICSPPSADVWRNCTMLNLWYSGFIMLQISGTKWWTMCLHISMYICKYIQHTCTENHQRKFSWEASELRWQRSWNRKKTQRKKKWREAKTTGNVTEKNNRKKSLVTVERQVSGQAQYLVMSSHRSRARRNSQKKPKKDPLGVYPNCGWGSFWDKIKLSPCNQLGNQMDVHRIANWHRTEEQGIEKKRTFIPVLWQFQLFAFRCFVIHELKPSMLAWTPRQTRKPPVLASVVQNNKPARVGSWYQTWVSHCVDYEPDGTQKHGADRSRWLQPTRR